MAFKLFQLDNLNTHSTSYKLHICIKRLICYNKARRWFKIKKCPVTAFFLILSLLSLAGCQTDDSHIKEEAPIQERPHSNSGIHLSTEKEIYTASDDEIAVNIENESPMEFSYSDYFAIEKKMNGKWYSVPFKEETFKGIGTLLQPKTSLSQPLSLGRLKKVCPQDNIGL